MIKIKPHHFIDIIKLYGKGIQKFIPDENYKHNFYAIANEIIDWHQVKIEITIDSDDICSPCRYLDEHGNCSDKIVHIDGITSKDEWNKILDNRIIKYLDTWEHNTYSAQEFCEILYSIKENINDIWMEESNLSKANRYDAFCKGAIKYLGI